MMLKKIFNNKGVSLVEIIISVAILSILSVSMLQIFTGSFTNVIESGRSNQGFYQAAGELDRAIREKTYTGTNNNIAHEETTVNILGTNIDVRIVRSKTDNIDSALNINTDQFIFAYVVDPDTPYVDQAFIDLDDDQVYDSDEIIVPAESLNGTYYYNGSGVLTINHIESLVDTIDFINWRVNNGIYIDGNLHIVASNSIKIESTSGDIYIGNGSSIEASDEIDLKASGLIDIQKTSVISENDDISFTANNIILSGNNTTTTAIESKSSIGSFDFYINDKITLNNYVSFKINGVQSYAINHNGAELETANDTQSPNKFR